MRDWSSTVIVTCETCSRWTRDHIAPEGIGRCEGEHYKTSTAPRGNGHMPYPNAPRYCGHHRPAGAQDGAVTPNQRGSEPCTEQITLMI